ncbi:N-acetyltransferase [Mycolicibacterium insubricum]|mgnify:CR=1 FL=1|uniref:GNAT family N-acetyltransferase n=1 Tax=Mycolicibacterium insubricum TaxID=444597 RepID=A0A1X0DMY9_9MYCO|nr:GNAT family N-acetyltransferase [Mycolicibacterium insubricum]MCB9441744.1 GNAT family N-acetyltransferase [Mycolicibacterium sp.]MCV7083396.1 GNAT family N-acetyltransferase [Mycolicibacterium insubricum]ORA73774.1 GNAT family N-acetyltransferase [Mycolicibacterium insubricum]BBZ67352.1 N-acetyltransferase [Mycolicibacterium insubricum]
MPAHDIAAARREISVAMLKALDRRHEVLDAIVDADDHTAAVDALIALLGISRAGAEAVMGLSFDHATKASRERIAAELEDLDSQLTFTVEQRPASTGESLWLRPFSAEQDRDIFTARTDDQLTAGDGSGAPAAGIDDEIRGAIKRVDDEDAVLFVAVEDEAKIGLVFGDLVGGEVNVRIWIRPEHRKKGYGTAALRKSRSEMASYFPAVPMVVRAPGAGSA